MRTLDSLLRNFSIRLRMLGAIVMVLTLFAIVGATVVVGGFRIQQLNQQFIHHALSKIETVGDVRTALARLRLVEKQMVIDYESADKVARLRAQWSEHVAATGAALKQIEADEEDEDNLLAREAQAQLQQYRTAAELVLKNVEGGQYDSATVADRMLGRAHGHMKEIEDRIDRINAIVKGESAATAQAMENTLRSLFWIFCSVLGSVVLIVVPLTLLNSRSITAPIAQAQALAQAIAEGDLTRQVVVQGKDEAAQLLGALQRMQTHLNRIVGQLHDASGSIHSASSEVAAGNTDLSQRTELAASSLQHTASAVAQISSTVNQTADSARTALQLSASASNVAQRGGQAVQQVVHTMGEINTSSRRIADIIGTIDGIAFQTNILALNAAVEAARAGEQGRGFAVVASEVRSLAQRSAGAAREIKGLIAASVERVENGTRQVQDAGSRMAEIVASVQRVADTIAEISAAATEQSKGVGQVNAAVAQLDQSTQQNAALVEQSAAAAESLREQATRLAGVVAAFRLQAA